MQGGWGGASVQCQLIWVPQGKLAGVPVATKPAGAVPAKVKGTHAGALLTAEGRGADPVSSPAVMAAVVPAKTIAAAAAANTSRRRRRAARAASPAWSRAGATAGTGLAFVGIGVSSSRTRARSPGSPDYTATCSRRAEHVGRWSSCSRRSAADRETSTWAAGHNAVGTSPSPPGYPGPPRSRPYLARRRTPTGPPHDVPGSGFPTHPPPAGHPIPGQSRRRWRLPAPGPRRTHAGAGHCANHQWPNSVPP
jgi:hypothetical protein